MNNTPLLVSILINNYNYGAYIREAIDSAVEQTYPHTEVIVVDDGSQDESISIINSYSNGTIKPILKENAGQASAFNAGFLASRGDIICFLDSDDYFQPNKVQEIVWKFLELPEIGWIFHCLKYVDENSSLLNLKGFKKPILKSRLADFRMVLRQGKRFNTVLPATSGLCFRQETLQKILPMPESQGVTIHDNYLKYASLFLSPGLLLSSELSSQRIHSSNLYTFSGNYRLHAEVSIKTSYYLRRNFPDIRLFADKVFAYGCGEMLAEANIQSLRNVSEFREYLSENRSFTMIVKGVLKVFFHYMRFKLRRFIPYYLSIFSFFLRTNNPSEYVKE
jgi:glycosyltransferase involved in cell wall biosynthesis